MSKKVYHITEVPRIGKLKSIMVRVFGKYLGEGYYQFRNCFYKVE